MRGGRRAARVRCACSVSTCSSPPTTGRYTTVVVGLEERFGESQNFETDAVDWVHVDDVERRDLHPGFAHAWPHLRAIVESAGTDARHRRRAPSTAGAADAGLGVTACRGSAWPVDEVGGEDVVVVVLHGEVAPAGGHRAQVDGVAAELARGHERDDLLLAVLGGVGALHPPAT